MIIAKPAGAVVFRRGQLGECILDVPNGLKSAHNSGEDTENKDDHVDEGKSIAYFISTNLEVDDSRHDEGKKGAARGTNKGNEESKIRDRDSNGSC